jgi:hypothetical protein
MQQTLGPGPRQLADLSWIKAKVQTNEQHFLFSQSGVALRPWAK